VPFEARSQIGVNAQVLGIGYWVLGIEYRGLLLIPNTPAYRQAGNTVIFNAKFLFTNSPQTLTFAAHYLLTKNQGE